MAVRATTLGTAGRKPFSLKAVLMLPVHAVGILSSTKSFRDNPVIGSPALNRRGLHIVRRRLAARLGERRRGSLAHLLSAEELAEFERDGFIIKRDFLDPATFKAFHDEIMALHVPAREALIGDTLTRLIPLDGPILRGMETVRRVLESKRYRGLLAYVGSFKRRPFFYVQTVFSQFAPGAEPDVQSFYHADTFHPTLKSWFFLHDVGEDAAPFAYVPGSHRSNLRRLAWERRMSVVAHGAGDKLTAEGSLRISEAEIRQLGYGEARKVPVTANTLVIADTSGIHRRSTTAKPSVRVSLWAYSRSNPFLPFAAGDIKAWNAVQSWGVRVYFAVADRIKDARGVKRDWGWAGLRSPLTPPEPGAGRS